ncbi:hypothetical protein BJX96DRAFT_186053 [Aspergillus floccosus]
MNTFLTPQYLQTALFIERDIANKVFLISVFLSFAGAKGYQSRLDDMARPLEISTSLEDHKLTDSEEALIAACAKGDVTFLADLAYALTEGREEMENPSEDYRMLNLLKHWKFFLPTSSFTPYDNRSPTSLSPQPADMNPQISHTTSSHQGDESVAGENKTRSEAITLIRARTLTRSSPTEASFQADMAIDNGLPPPASESHLPPVALMDLVQKPKMKKSGKSKSKKQKSKRRDVSKSPENKDSGLDIPDDAKEKEVDTEVNNDQDTQAPSLPVPALDNPVSTKLEEADSSNVITEDKSDIGDSAKESRPENHEDAVVDQKESRQDTVSQAPSALSFAAVLAGSMDKLGLKSKGSGTCDGTLNSSSDGMSSTGSKYAIKPNETTQLDGVFPSFKENKGHKTCGGSSSRSSTVESSSQSSPGGFQQSSRNVATQKEKLPAILEASPEDNEDSSIQGSPSASNQSPTCTPKSTSTGLTAWNAFSQQNTPRTDITDDSQLRGTKNKRAQKNSASTRTESLIQLNGDTSSSHTHPPTSTDKGNQESASSKKKSKSSKKEGFWWNLDSHGFPCAKEGCDKCCNLWDGATVICPRCGPYSECRYCCKEHLVSDIKPHWTICGQMTFQHPCKESTIPKDVRNGPAFVPCLHPYDTPERHRQAVYLNMNSKAGDYFIFSDWADNMEAGFPENNVALRCSNRVVYIIKFDDAEKKDRFRRVLATCLFMTIEVTELVDYLYRLIRDKLRSEGAPAELETAVQYQFFQEFAVTIQAAITGQRHACETDWDGRNRRCCPDAVDVTGSSVRPEIRTPT